MRLKAHQAFLSGLALVPGTCLASDPRPMIFLFTVPILIASLLIAYAIATKSLARAGYVWIAVLLLVNSYPGLNLAYSYGIELTFTAAIHLLFPLLFIPAFFVLHGRLSRQGHEG